MIEYKTSRSGLVPLMQMSGSVVPRAFSIAAAPAIFACVLRIYLVITEQELMDTEFKKESFSKIYSTFFWFLGFILVFRTTAAYNRYWDGVNQLNLTATEWHDACSQLCAFAASSGQPENDIRAFTECIIRLFSLMHALAMQDVAIMEDEDFEVLDSEAFDQDLLKELHAMDGPGSKKHVVHQWIQRVILEAINSGLINAPAPIVTRCFQELNAGMTSVARLRTIGGVQFPFPYAQMISYSLVLFSVITPIFFCIMNIHPAVACLGAFTAVVPPFALNLIAHEIEQPLGDDPNDLRCNEAQEEMNSALLNLLKPVAFSCPNYRWDPGTPTLKDKGRRSLQRLSTVLNLSPDRPPVEPSSENPSACVDIESGDQQGSGDGPQPDSSGHACGESQHNAAQVVSLCRSEAQVAHHKENERQQKLSQQQHHHQLQQCNDTAALATAVVTAGLDSRSGDQMHEHHPQQTQPQLHLHMPVMMQPLEMVQDSGKQQNLNFKQLHQQMQWQEQRKQQEDAPAPTQSTPYHVRHGHAQYEEEYLESRDYPHEEWMPERSAYCGCRPWSAPRSQSEYPELRGYPSEEGTPERFPRYAFKLRSARKSQSVSRPLSCERQSKFVQRSRDPILMLDDAVPHPARLVRACNLVYLD
eukprot:gnl/MRDRNA2_/MRDRNA2_82289_c0_seq1.p1 gnl/MRDRNA2_/MRDRNA2_82289_c0~~gnl/MRDRNA2_/MRDRNA2_82289_c0_seq1.p1  ORF type:complete len:642 (+),score=111.04 gnl/MRDRNA2_/MRDRNA2_82289_c0_seq1:80-2005(+)